MSAHEPRQSVQFDWWTPPHIFEALGLEFGLDVAAPAGGVPWLPARRSYSSNSLARPRGGLIWMNPPYGNDIGRWVERFIKHSNGVALVFARTDTKWWHEWAFDAEVICFIRGRLNFIRGDGGQATSNAGAPSALLGVGRGADAVRNCGLGRVR